MKNFFHFTCLFVSVCIYSQTESADTSVISKIKNEAYEHSAVMDHAFYITDYSGARLTWSPGYDRAAEWTLKEFKNWGLQNVHKEEWEPLGKSWDIVKSYVALKVPTIKVLLQLQKHGQEVPMVLLLPMLCLLKQKTVWTLSKSILVN